MRTWMLRGGMILLGGMLLWVLCGAFLGHDPNYGIDREKAREAAYRVHATPNPAIKMEPGHGG